MMHRLPAKRRAIRCKDCNAITISPGPIQDGWRWIDLVDGADICNGWRCPHCVAGWDVILEAAVSHQTFH